MITEKPKILNYMNIFRGIAIIFIVLGHSIDVENPLIKRVLMEFFAHGTIIFLFIAGFLFHYLSVNFDFGIYLKKKWLNVIMPYILTSIPGIIYCLFHHNIFSVYSPVIQIPLYLITGIIHNPPTWYIPLISVYFLFAKTFITLEKKNILYKIIPLFALLTIFLQRPQWSDSSNISITSFYNYLPLIYIILIIVISLHFVFVYLLGMYFSSNKDKIKGLYRYRAVIWVLFILSSVIDIYLMKYNLPQNGDISKIFLSLLLLGYLKHYDLKIRKHKKINKIFTKIAKYSFGIFFVHWYTLMIFNKLFSNNFSQVSDIYSCAGNISFMLFKFIFVFLTSFGICYFVKRILNKIGITKTRSLIGV